MQRINLQQSNMEQIGRNRITPLNLIVVDRLNLMARSFFESWQDKDLGLR
jgi:hypothetical protein